MLARSTQPVPLGQPKRRHMVTANVLAANRHSFDKANPVPKEIPYLPTPKRTAACRQNCSSGGRLVRRSARLFASAKKADAVVAHLAFATWVLFNREEHTSAAHLAKHSRRITAEPVSHIARVKRTARHNKSQERAKKVKSDSCKSLIRRHVPRNEPERSWILHPHRLSEISKKTHAPVFHRRRNLSCRSPASHSPAGLFVSPKAEPKWQSCFQYLSGISEIPGTRVVFCTSVGI
jgi:hypothetical protein